MVCLIESLDSFFYLTSRSESDEGKSTSVKVTPKLAIEPGSPGPEPFFVSHSF